MGHSDLLETAVEAARAAAAVHRRHAGTVRVEDWSEKGAADFVTHVDRESEAVVMEIIRRRFPGHAFLAEEETSERYGVSGVTVSGSSETVWVIDPLDGTTNFLHGYPMHAVSIAAVDRGEPVAAVVLNSASGEEWTAQAGGGAVRNGEPIRVSSIDRLPHCLVGTGFPFKAQHLLPHYMRQFEAVLRATSGVRRAGSAALDLCHVATGWFDGFWELTLAPWDVAAGVLIVREAGGIVTRLDSNDADMIGHGSVLAGNPAVHRMLHEVLRAVDETRAAPVQETR